MVRSMTDVQPSNEKGIAPNADGKPPKLSRFSRHIVEGSSGEGQCDNRGPNAMVRWATDFDPETSRWLELSLDEIDELVKKGRRGLSLEIVALRDIRADEEVRTNVFD